jgi:hypothetical protein
MLRSVIRDATFTPEHIELATQLHAAGLMRQWQPGDRLLGGAPPVRVVRSVSIDGDPLVEVERGGRVQTVAVAQPQVWLPSVADVLELLDDHGCEGALMFRSERYALKYRQADSAAEYCLLRGRDPRTVCYQALLHLCRAGGLEVAEERA